MIVRKQKPRKLIPFNKQVIRQAPSLGRYDAIVVGAGPAGLSAAYFMATAGMEVLVLERGPYPGAKSCGGLSIVSEHVHGLFPNFWEECQCERVITNLGYWFMTEDSMLALTYHSLRLTAAPYSRFTVKRTNLYKWLAAKAVAAGATLLFGHTVKHLIFDGNQAVGVQVPAPQNTVFYGNIMVLADGANALVAEQSGLLPPVSPQNMALYVKETIALAPEIIESRFNLLPGQGAIWGLIGYPTNGFNGTASLHTFKDSISINVGMAVSNFANLPYGRRTF